MQRHTMLKRLISLVMVFVMLFGLVPTFGSVSDAAFNVQKVKKTEFLGNNLILLTDHPNTIPKVTVENAESGVFMSETNPNLELFDFRRAKSVGIFMLDEDTNHFNYRSSKPNDSRYQQSKLFGQYYVGPLLAQEAEDLIHSPYTSFRDGFGSVNFFIPRNILEAYEKNEAPSPVIKVRYSDNAVYRDPKTGTKKDLDVEVAFSDFLFNVDRNFSEKDVSFDGYGGIGGSVSYNLASGWEFVGPIQATKVQFTFFEKDSNTPVTLEGDTFMTFASLNWNGSQAPTPEDYYSVPNGVWKPGYSTKANNTNYRDSTDASHVEFVGMLTPNNETIDVRLTEDTNIKEYSFLQNGQLPTGTNLPKINTRGLRYVAKQPKFDGVTVYGGGSEKDFFDTVGSASYTKNAVAFNFGGIQSPQFLTGTLLHQTWPEQTNYDQHRVNIHGWVFPSTSNVFHSTPEKPTKTVSDVDEIDVVSNEFVDLDEKDYEVLTYKVNQKVFTMGVDDNEYYTRFAISDVVSVEVDYIKDSAKFLRDGKDNSIVRTMSLNIFTHPHMRDSTYVDNFTGSRISLFRIKIFNGDP